MPRLLEERDVATSHDPFRYGRDGGWWIMNTVVVTPRHLRNHGEFG
jgi:hypothetical protein